MIRSRRRIGSLSNGKCHPERSEGSCRRRSNHSRRRSLAFARDDRSRSLGMTIDSPPPLGTTARFHLVSPPPVPGSAASPSSSPPTAAAAGARARSRCAAAGATSARAGRSPSRRRTSFAGTLAPRRGRASRASATTSVPSAMRRGRGHAERRRERHGSWPSISSVLLLQARDRLLPLELTRVDHADRHEDQVGEVPGKGAEDVEHGVNADAAKGVHQHRRGRGVVVECRPDGRLGAGHTRRAGCPGRGRAGPPWHRPRGSGRLIDAQSPMTQRGHHDRDPASLAELLEHRDPENRHAEPESGGEQRQPRLATRAAVPGAGPRTAASRTSTARTSRRR